MKIEYSKSFIKQAKRLDDATKNSLKEKIKEVKEAKRVSEIKDCIKMSGYERVYHIRISDYRVIFIHEEDEVLFFQYIASRGKIYSKKYFDTIKRK